MSKDGILNICLGFKSLTSIGCYSSVTVEVMVKCMSPQDIPN